MLTLETDRKKLIRLAMVSTKIGDVSFVTEKQCKKQYESEKIRSVDAKSSTD